MILPYREIQLPVKDHSGQSTAALHALFQASLLRLAGGYSMAPVSGNWRNGCQDYVETMVSYRIAAPILVWDDILEEAGRLFPDQLTFFVADLGTADVLVNRKEIAA